MFCVYNIVMNIEDRVFAKSKIEEDRLIAYGFKKENDVYTYRTKLCDGFDLIVNYDEKISVKVIDKELDDEYLNYRYTGQGSFAAEIANKVEIELMEMKNFFSTPLNYRSDQANFLDDYMAMVYGKVQFSFKDNPDIGVYKQSGDKWYALIMKVNINKLNKDLPDEDVEIINLKVEKKELSSLVKKKGIYPAYHMNKQNWVSVVLDENVSTSDLILMINKSYDLVEKTQNEKKFYYRNSF